MNYRVLQPSREDFEAALLIKELLRKGDELGVAWLIEEIRSASFMAGGKEMRVRIEDYLETFDR